MRQLLLDRAKWTMGWMLTEELSFLAEIAQGLKSNSIVFEIGSFCGKSARVIADNAPEGCKIYCIDPWDFQIPLYDQSGNLTEVMIVDGATYHQFCLNLSDHIQSGKVIPVRMKWSGFSSDIKADFIFIDGDHTYEAANHDIRKAKDYIRADGIIAGHDYQNFEGVLKAVNEHFQKDAFGVKESIWWTRKS